MELHEIMDQYDFLNLFIGRYKDLYSHETGYYCHFDHTEMKEGMFLVGASGHGQTVSEAIENYLEKLPGQTLIYKDMSDDRKEIKFRLK